MRENKVNEAKARIESAIMTLQGFPRNVRSLTLLLGTLDEALDELELNVQYARHDIESLQRELIEERTKHLEQE